MIEQILRNGVRTGVVFGIVIIFFILIGFNIAAVDLIGNMIKVSNDMVNMLIYLGILGIWAGASGAGRKEHEQRRWGILAGAISGLVSGLLLAGLTFTLAILRENGIDLRAYLNALSPQVIGRALLGKSIPQACLTYIAMMTSFGVLGGLLAQLSGRVNIGHIFEIGWQKVAETLARIPFYQRARQTSFAKYLLYALLMIVILLIPQWLNQYWNYNLGTVGIYVLLGLGLNIVVGMAGLLDLGYVAFFAIGAYTMALLTAPRPYALYWNFWAVLPLGIVLASLSGILLGIPVLRMRGDYLAIVTLGFGEIIRILLKSDAMLPYTGGPRGVIGVGRPVLFGKALNEVGFMYLILLGIFLVIYLTERFKNSYVGRAWGAMREDETVARAVGINVLKYKLLAFAVGAAFAGLGGVLFASRNQFTGPEDHNLMVSINVLCLVIVGGMGSIPGVIMGALTLKGLPELLRQLEDFRMLAFGALLVIMMIVRPEGLWPSRQRKLEIKADEDVGEEIDTETTLGGEGVRR